MFLHYLKTAFRNISRFKIQSIIVILSIALGMVFCSLTLMWIRYERSYDSFHRDADDIYLVMGKLANSKTDDFYPATEFSKGPYLAEKYPCIEEYARCSYKSTYYVLRDGSYVASLIGLTIDENFRSFFDVKVLEGDPYLNLAKDEIALTRTQADKLFEGRTAVGDTLHLNFDVYTIKAVVEDPGKPTSLPYDFLKGFDLEWQTEQRTIDARLFIRVNHDNLEQLAQDIEYDSLVYETTDIGPDGKEARYIHDYSQNFKLVHLTKIRTDGILEQYFQDSIITNQKINITLYYIYILMLLGIVLIVCSLTNYFTLFITKMRMRMREISLRYANGAGTGQILMLFCTEIAMILLLSLMAGAVICSFTMPYYKELSVIDKSTVILILSYLLYASVIGLISTLIALVIISLTGRKQSAGNLGYKISIGFQLAVSICAIFCSVVISRQINHLLLSSDMGYRKHNVGAMFLVDITESEVMAVRDKLMMLPELDNVVFGYYPTNYFVHVPVWSVYYNRNSADAAVAPANREYLDLIEVELIAGELFSENESDNAVIINETMANQFGGPDQVIGEELDYYGYPYYGGHPMTIKGVIKDICFFDPKKEALPFAFYFKKESNVAGLMDPHYFIFTYKEGVKWNDLHKKILDLATEIRPNPAGNIIDMETDYMEFIKSENTLCKLFRIITLICVIIAISGLYSIVSLLCQKRRKEIAIRKINGARMDDILKMFLKDYLPIIIFSAVVAFSAGTIIMHRWLSHYVRQTPMTAWVYLSVLMCMLLVIGITVFGNIRRAMVENPADVIKSE